jgi:predicted nucleotidyltransferase
MHREAAIAQSDIDLLVKSSHPVSLLAFIRLRPRLAEILGRHGNLATPQSLRPAWREHLLREAVPVV